MCDHHYGANGISRHYYATWYTHSLTYYMLFCIFAQPDPPTRYTNQAHAPTDIYPTIQGSAGQLEVHIHTSNPSQIFVKSGSG